ncbi:hypothetical protein BGZ96_012520 [Linnemannia gamsii]|uniref:Uncharacterized protein n=1 Tax=Linnemannia gamsii TaxID=64522 RepID=A0ABQ7JQL7_9FUNG|nr:hypothetical protein BGZ96_012520 [Linnemannia gamsii]
MEAMSVQTRLAVYDGVIDGERWKAAREASYNSTFNAIHINEQEIFETTNVKETSLCLLMTVAGFIVSRGIPSTIREPLTEVLHEVYSSSSKNKKFFFGDNKKVPWLSFRKRRIANLLLELQPVKDSKTYNNKTNSCNRNSLASSTTSMSEMATAAARSSSPPSNSGRQRRTLVLRMELESDDEDDAVELLERKKSQVIVSSRHIAFHTDE